ncbi:uncharacterized protein LOC113232153 [Hyposmocoma kahamanoa]|uniref:uncharacterized protein LOC113232153 n=1 Tax=Hyposmocoma kahamanoa TaxID=1477025 RepID=UPI000E6D9C05|nr:uncharacterized protein LOC113232153 [Hyposmocoma kahamanoa]
MNMSKRDCNGWVLCPSQRLPGKFYFFNTLSGEAVWSLNELEKRTARQNDIQHVKWLSYPEPDCPPEEPTTNPWQPKRLSSWGRQTPSFGQVAFPKYTPNLGPTMTPNICSNISSNMPNHMGPSTNQIMAPHMTVLGGPNDTYINMPYPIPLSMMNHDWQRNFEPNMPYWSPEMDGPTSGVPKRFFRYENPINKIGESSYNKNNWIQQQMCNKRQVFGQKQNNDSNCPTVINDQNAFGLNRDTMSGKKSVFNTNNKQIFKETWRQPDVYNAVKHTFGRLNSSEDFELPCKLTPQLWSHNPSPQQ